MRWLATIALLCTAMLTPSIAMASEPESPPEEAVVSQGIRVKGEKITPQERADSLRRLGYALGSR
jgi:hypothetical protein